MKRNTEYGCENCGRSPKSIPYGSKRGLFYCSFCDMGCSTGVSKTRERQKSKKNLAIYKKREYS